MINEQALWEQTKKYIASQENNSLLIQTCESINGVYKLENGYIYLIVATSLDKYRVEKFYLEAFNKALASVTTETVRFKIITKDDVDSEIANITVPKTIEPKKASSLSHRLLNAEYTFDNFIVGDANKEAYTFASKIAENASVSINPFYIFGGVGLGKTHLMNAIGHKILDNDVTKKIVYVTSQQFIDDFFKAKNRNQKNLELIEEFDDFYHNADCLLVDDIQFLENKTASQEEFFKIFEDLFNKNKQIIVTSDRPANELNVMARLKSRFSWGMQTNLKKPNANLRFNIAKDKLKFMIDDPKDVPNEVIEYIADNFDENIRELEGALRRFISYCVSFNTPFTLENAKNILQPIINSDKKTSNDENTSKLEVIKEATARYFNINVKELTSTSRKKELVYARNLIIYIGKTKFDISLNQLGDNLGRDHTTAMHSYQKMCTLASSDDAVKEDISNILKIIDKK